MPAKRRGAASAAAPRATKGGKPAAGSNDDTLNFQGFISAKAAECLVIDKPPGAFVVWQKNERHFGVTYRSLYAKSIESLFLECAAAPPGSGSSTGVHYSAAMAVDKTTAPHFDTINEFLRSRAYLVTEEDKFCAIPRDRALEVQQARATAADRDLAEMRLRKMRQRLLLERDALEGMQRDVALESAPGALAAARRGVRRARGVCLFVLLPAVLGLVVLAALVFLFLGGSHHDTASAAASVQALHADVAAAVRGGQGTLVGDGLYVQLKPWLEGRDTRSTRPETSLFMQSCAEQVDKWAAEVGELRASAQARFHDTQVATLAWVALSGALCAGGLVLFLIMASAQVKGPEGAGGADTDAIDEGIIMGADLDVGRGAAGGGGDAGAADPVAARLREHARLSVRDPSRAWHGGRKNVRMWAMLAVATAAMVGCLIAWFQFVSMAAPVSTLLQAAGGEARKLYDYETMLEVPSLPVECARRVEIVAKSHENVPLRLRLPLLPGGAGSIPADKVDDAIARAAAVFRSAPRGSMFFGARTRGRNATASAAAASEAPAFDTMPANVATSSVLVPDFMPLLDLRSLQLLLGAVLHLPVVGRLVAAVTGRLLRLRWLFLRVPTSSDVPYFIMMVCVALVGTGIMVLLLREFSNEAAAAATRRRRKAIVARLRAQEERERAAAKSRAATADGKKHK